MDFPKLFGEASTGKKKVWMIKVEDRDGVGVIITTHGYDGMKMVVNEKEVSAGKNKGKKNETTPIQQAISDARALWQKKKDAGYAEEGGEAAAGAGGGFEGIAESRAKASVSEVPLPMLAHEFGKRGKSFPFPCYVQRKFDGTRCVAVPGVGLFSRNRKKYPHMEHILEDLKGLPSDLILDGELYSDSLTFQEIVGLVKRETLKAGDIEKMKQIYYHVYDIIYDAKYEERLYRLGMLFKECKFKYIRLVETEECSDRDMLKVLHDKYVAEGFEGIMLRNKNGLYKVGQRSVDLLKYKEFMDDEYEVVDFKEGDGVEKGCVIWVCKTAKGQTFACRPAGTHAERAEYLKNGGDYIGRKLSIRFQELTDEGLPRFPVGIAFRDYE